MKFRNEWKHEISYFDKVTLQARLRTVAKPEVHGVRGRYEIFSLYFDDCFDTALREKIDGVNMREKFRIRYYDHDPSFIRLEKKSKVNGLCLKQQARLCASEVERILSGDIEWMMTDKRALLPELYVKMKSKGLRPKTVVTYTREAFTFPAGNVRVTLDDHIRTGWQIVDFLNPALLTVPVIDDRIILEVKWDEYLPDLIRDAVMMEGRHSSAFSKYAACRVYG